MAVSAFRSTTRRDFQEIPGQDHRRALSHSTDSGSVLDGATNYQDASSQRDSDQETIEPGVFNRRPQSDSESEASSIIDRFRLTETSRNAASVPRFQQSTASARGRQRSIDPSRRRSESRGPETRRRSESQEPGLRRQSSSDFSSRYRRSESQEPGLRRQSQVEPGGVRQSFTLESSSESKVHSRDAGFSRQGRSQSKEPSTGRIRSESQEPRHLRSSSREPVARHSSQHGVVPSEEDSRRGRSTQRPDVVFTSRSTSQEPRRRSYSREPIGKHRRSESQGPESRLQGSDVQTEERTIRAVHAQLKQTDPPAGDVDDANILGVMRDEVRKAVADLKAEIEESLEKDMLTLVASKGNVAESDVRQKYAEKLEESESRTQELLAQLAKEEEKRQELAKLVKGLPSAKAKSEHPRRRTRRGLEERASISQALDEEAQKYFEEFAAISTSETEESMDGRSSSKPGKRPTAQSSKSAGSSKKSPARKQVSSRSEEFPSWKTGPVALNTDGVVTPWLDWETDSADATTAISDFNWDSLDTSSRSADLDSVRVSEELGLQRIRFMERLGAGRIHLCRTEF